MSHLPLIQVGLALDEQPDNFPDGFQQLWLDCSNDATCSYPSADLQSAALSSGASDA